MTSTTGLVFKAVFNGKVAAAARTARTDAPSDALTPTAMNDRWVAPERPDAPRAPSAKPRTGTEKSEPTRLARMLALAHVIERQVNTGGARSYAEVADRLGITPARITQITNLLSLAPILQERILDGTLDSNERDLRSVLRSMRWSDHEAAFETAVTSVTSS